MPTISELYEAGIVQGQLRDDKAQRAALPLLDRAVAALNAPQPSRKGWRGLFSSKPEPRPDQGGVYLWGGVGRGKSMLMDLVMDAADTSAKRRVHFHAFMQEIQAGLDEARRKGQQDAVRPVAEKVADEVRLLCFDEMQITDIADAMIVGRLFEVLFERNVMVVTTSNRAPQDLYKDGLNRQLFLPFIDLLQDRLEVYELSSPNDHRQDRVKGNQVWFTPTGPDARQSMDEVWTDLTKGAVPAPLTIPVKGREVEIAAFVDGIGRCSFWDLCGRPLGPADYLAVAEALRVLMIDNIPRLSSANFNEAKRFVTLIDALYEAKVRVIASAAEVGS